MEKKVSVIIPAFNEEENIASVIHTAKKCKYVKEIIVVDNKSTDRTEEIAKKEGAKVVKCEQQGKGYAMEEGIKHVENNIIVFLDADIADYTEDVVDKLVVPIIEKDIDFLIKEINQSAPFAFKKEHITVGTHGQYTPAVGAALFYIDHFIQSV